MARKTGCIQGQGMPLEQGLMTVTTVGAGPASVFRQTIQATAVGTNEMHDILGVHSAYPFQDEIRLLNMGDWAIFNLNPDIFCAPALAADRVVVSESNHD